MNTTRTGYNLSMEVNGINLSYDDLGEGRIPIIFLHGFPFDKTMWAGQLDYLKMTYRLIALDIRGFGKSTDEHTPLNISLFADDLIEFMNKLDIEKAIVCGLSMGGYIILNAAKRYPERFEALILSDTQCIADTPEVKEKRLNDITEIEEKGAANFNERFIKSVFYKDSLIQKKEVVEDLKKVVLANSDRIIMQGLLALAVRTETCSTLDKIKIPTLIICGREDAVTPLDKSEYLKQHIQGSILKVIDDAGHVSNLEQPDKFNECLSEFLMSLSDDHAENWLENQRTFR